MPFKPDPLSSPWLPQRLALANGYTQNTPIPKNPTLIANRQTRNNKRMHPTGMGGRVSL
jgi:hypothetical protein